MLKAFSRMSADLFKVLGEECWLRGDSPCSANIEHGVRLEGEYDDGYIERSIVTIHSNFKPRSGDSIAFEKVGSVWTECYRLDTRYQSSGLVERWIVVKQ